MQTTAQRWLEKDIDNERHLGDSSVNDDCTAVVYADDWQSVYTAIVCVNNGCIV